MAATLDAARPPATRFADAVATGLAASGAVAAALALVGALTATTDRPDTAVSVLHVAGGALYLAAGVLAAVRRPRNRTGMLLLAAGLAWFVTDARYVAGSVGYTVADLFGVAYFAMIGHLALAFPSGRVAPARDRAVLAVAYLWAVLGNILPEVLWAPAQSCDGCLHNLLALRRDPGLHDVVGQLHQAGNIVAGAVVLAAVVAHVRRATPPARRALAPVVWASGPIFGLLLALNLVGIVASPGWLTAALPALTPVALASLPVCVLIGFLRGRMARLAVGPLVVELDSAAQPDALEAVLARTLGDPSVEVAYPAPGGSGWVDAAGRPRPLPEGDPSRSVTTLERASAPIAAIVHDPSLDDEPELMASVAAAAALALDNERLRADVLARLAEVRSSRARIVEAADQARRRLERDLHDGAQQRLLALGLRLGVARDRAARGRSAEAARELEDAVDELRQAIAELRELAAGVHPHVLSEGGLGPALEALAEGAAVPVRILATPQRRLPQAVEAAAWFVASEALANVAKHSGARTATVSCVEEEGTLRLVVADDGCGGASTQRGSGLRGLADRVAALDGRLTVDSPAGGGTRVVAELPCA